MKPNQIRINKTKKKRKREKTPIVFVHHASLAHRQPADRQVVIGDAILQFSFFFCFCFSCVLLRIAPQTLSLNALRYFLPLKSNSTSYRSSLDYFSKDRPSLVLRLILNERKVFTLVFACNMQSRPSTMTFDTTKILLFPVQISGRFSHC